MRLVRAGHVNLHGTMKGWSGPAGFIYMEYVGKVGQGRPGSFTWNYERKIKMVLKEGSLLSHQGGLCLTDH